MLREIVVETKPNGKPINIPVEVDETKMDQYIKRFAETADYSFQDGSGVVSLFRSFHGGQVTLRILRAVINELQHPSIHLELEGNREELVVFFEGLLQRHQQANDAEFGYPNRDRSVLPM